LGVNRKHPYGIPRIERAEYAPVIGHGQLVQAQYGQHQEPQQHDGPESLAYIAGAKLLKKKQYGKYGHHYIYNGHIAYLEKRRNIAQPFYGGWEGDGRLYHAIGRRGSPAYHGQEH